MGKVIGSVLCVAGALFLLGPWIYAYGREWLAIRAGRDRDLEHRDLDAFDWTYLIGWWGIHGIGLIAIGAAIFSKY